MRAKLFDPFTEEAVNAWLATAPVKTIHSSQLFELGGSTLGGDRRQVALVFYEEERSIGPGKAAGTQDPTAITRAVDRLIEPPSSGRSEQPPAFC